MDLYLSNEALSGLRQALDPGAAAPSVEQRTALAWQLRQRDERAALRLADEIEPQLLALPPGRRAARLRARLQLLRAEVELNRGQLAAAAAQLDAAEQGFIQQGDLLGQGDVCWARCSLGIDGGQPALFDASLNQAEQLYREAGEPLRQQMVLARREMWNAFRQPEATERRLLQSFPLDQDYPALVAAWVQAAYACVAEVLDDKPAALRHFMASYQASMDSGQIRQAAISMSNAAEAYGRLGDLSASLVWCERSLQEARATGWPCIVGLSLARSGTALRRLARHGDARQHLREALQQLQRLPGSRNYKICLSQLAANELESGHPADALAPLEQLAMLARRPLEADLLGEALRGQADAFIQLGRFDEGASQARAALELAREHGMTDAQVQALRLLARLPATHQAGLAGEAGSPALHHLGEAVRIAHAQASAGYVCGADLLFDYARALADSGEFRQAYDYLQSANETQRQAMSAQAQRRAEAMQDRFELERAQAEAEAHRSTAQNLREANAGLETLAVIGRELTAQLDGDAILCSLHRHVGELLDATVFLVLLLEADGRALHLAFGREAGTALPARAIALDDGDSLAAQCAREHREILACADEASLALGVVPGTLVPRSMVYMPLLAGERLLGVMSVQSPRPDAYGERELAIVRALGAYGAIALGNAHTLEALQYAHEELTRQEKLASLGALVAGVAHELNTPIGNAVLVASSLSAEIEALRERMQDGRLRKSDLEQFCLRAGQGDQLLLRNLDKASHLIRGFKQLAVDRASEMRRSFALLELCEEVLLSLSNQVRQAGHELKIDVPDDLVLDSYPGPLGQVLSNLLLNAMTHAFEERTGGQMCIQACRVGQDSLRLSFSDNGRGIAPENIDRVFDPFFTTRLGQGGSGLGLHLSYNIVDSVLGGRISVSSPAGMGACFEIVLPLSAPAHG